MFCAYSILLELKAHWGELKDISEKDVNYLRLIPDFIRLE